jgi:hypothetical protein
MIHNVSGHAHVVLTVAGHGCRRCKAYRAAGSRLILPLASRLQLAHPTEQGRMAI